MVSGRWSPPPQWDAAVLSLCLFFFFFFSISCRTISRARRVVGDLGATVILPKGLISHLASLLLMQQRLVFVGFSTFVLLNFETGE